MISPILYLIAFGWGLGSNVEVNGMSYMNFVIPGIIAMSTMSVSFGTVANSLNISRTYDKTFEEFMTSPIHMWEYTAGKILSGALRGLYSAILMILLSFIFKADLTINGYFVLLTLLNCLVFSSLGFLIGMVITSHVDMSKFTNFIITPMSFLCGTFFPIEKMPMVLKEIIYILPLTQSTVGLRASTQLTATWWISPAVLLVYLGIFMFASIRLCQKAE